MPYISEVSTIYIQRMYTGWISLRNQLITPIRIMGRRVIELYDALIAGNDWEVTPALSLKRRAGHTAYVTTNFATQFLYSWKTNTMGTLPIIDTTGDIEYVAVGAASTTLLFTKTPNTSQSSVFGVGDYLYVGNPGFTFKWNGPASSGTQNWGIAYANTSFGPTICTTGANGSGSGTAWTTPNNVTTTGSSYATINLASNVHSKQLIASGFGFSVPAGTVITGISVSATVQNVNGELQFQLNNSASGFIGGTKAAPSTSTPTGIILGGSADLWHATSITTTQVNGGNFQVVITAGGTRPTGVIDVNNVVVTIFTGGGPTGTPTGAGTFSAVNGFSYAVAYGNSASGEISNAAGPGPNTGPFTSKAYVGVPVTASTDTQVDQIRVYRTTDSGGGNLLFEIANSPFANTTATIQDTTTDLQLQTTSQPELYLGNTPPPAGITNLNWFSGRMWGSVNNILFASTGPETISGTAPQSNWNPLFQWVMPGVIVRIVTGPNGQLVFTNDDCYIVRGTDITNYTVNLFVKDFGIRTYNAIDTDGTNIYVFTSDVQFIAINASGAQDIGLPIADQLANIDATQVYVTLNRYALDSICRILDTVNNVYYDFNLNQQCWNLPGILKMSACTASGSIETSPGVWRLLLQTTNAGISKLAYRDITNFQDLTTSYTPNAVFGTIQLADPGQLAKFGPLGGMVLEFTSAGTLPTLSVLTNDIGCTLSNAVGSQITGNFVSLSTPGNAFNFPPTLGAQAKNYRSLGYYWNGGKALSGFVRHMQFQVAAIAENKATELIGFGIFGDLKQESPQAGQAPVVQGR